MNSSVLVQVIAACVAVAVAALTYLFTKSKEREADWRKWKYEQYKEFVLSLSGIVGTDLTDEGQRNFAKASNTLHLIGSKGVLNSLHGLQDEIRSSNPNRNSSEADKLLSRLVWEIRRDLGISHTTNPNEFTVRLWSSGIDQK